MAYDLSSYSGRWEISEIVAQKIIIKGYKEFSEFYQKEQVRGGAWGIAGLFHDIEGTLEIKSDGSVKFQVSRVEPDPQNSQIEDPKRWLNETVWVPGPPDELSGKPLCARSGRLKPEQIRQALRGREPVAFMLSSDDIGMWVFTNGCID